MTSKIDRFQEFIDWLNNELDIRGMSDRALAHRGGISQSSISLIRSGQRPGLKVLHAVAKGLDVPLSLVLQKAGLEEPVEETPLFKQARHYFDQLTEDEQDIILSQMRALVERRKRMEQEQGRRGVEPGAQPA